jgi:hypothetical protein
MQHLQCNRYAGRFRGIDAKQARRTVNRASED